MKSELAQFIETLPDELKSIPEVFYAPYGFKLIEFKGKKRWCPGTFDDYQQAEASRLGVHASTIEPKTMPSCANSSPTTCTGDCQPFPVGECGGELVANYVYCHCVV